jgi:hypothetical protein
VDSIYRAIPANYALSASLINAYGETIGTARRTISGSSSSSFSQNNATITFEGIDANKITDKLTVEITEVNGMNSKTAGERGYIRIFPEDFALLEDTFTVAWRFGNIEISDYKGKSKAVVIPEKIGPWPVTSIRDSAFYSEKLTSVTIPGSVTSIGKEAFRGNQLTSVTIPGSVTSIGERAFAYNQLTSVTIPGSVTSIGGGAFSQNQLTSVTIPGSVTSIGDAAFSYNQLTSVIFPGSVTSIGREAFYHNQLKSVTIPGSVTSIGGSAFSQNQLTEVILPANVELGSSALPCKEVYEKNDKKAGRYYLNQKEWQFYEKLTFWEILLGVGILVWGIIFLAPYISL